ncbi:GTPase IMAP family member 9-like [Myxocyprinus asiaticus]|uniref:GTPase IMAP family member 9-like n=1 Tax=Myxocyprinus asiaticus TaxID=70543 RepID=UPI0022224E1E|nr:GTPase IMAP family member 9-like [Myxocyprinus asiaticus]
MSLDIGNSILGEKMFHAEASPEEVTKECSRRYVEHEGKTISVTDMPGFCGSMTKEEMKTHIEQCVYMSVPGPHVFLLVINLGVRYTAEEMNMVKLIQQNFGVDATRYTIVLFTHADQLKGKNLQHYVGESKHLRNLTESCGGRYHAFNNENMMNCSQVKELLKKIDNTIKGNGGTHYTNDMFEKAQKKIKNKEVLKKTVDIALGAGSVLGTGAAVAGGVVLGVTEAMVLPAVILTAGTATAVGMGANFAVRKIKENRERDRKNN